VLAAAVAIPVGVASGQIAAPRVDTVAVVRAVWNAVTVNWKRPADDPVLWFWAPAEPNSTGAIPLSATVRAALMRGGVPASTHQPAGDDTLVFRLASWRDTSVGVNVELASRLTTVLRGGHRACRARSGSFERFLVRHRGSVWTAEPGRAMVGDNACGPIVGSVHGDAFFASALGVRKHFMVYLPPSYQTNGVKRYPVAYYLHGLSGTETDWLSRAAIDAVADSLIGAGAPEMIIVMPDGDDSWYATPTEPVPYATCRDSIRSESAERGCVKSSHYAEYIARDLVGYVDAHYRTLADRAHRGIGGLSMGGYGAVKLALQFPDVFAAAASHSGVLSPRLIGPNPFTLPPQYAARADTLLRLKLPGPTIFGHDLSAWLDNDPAILASRLEKTGRPMPAIYMDVGRSDPFLHENQAFDFELSRLGIRHEYHEYAGTHNWRFWSTHIPESLAWMDSAINRVPSVTR
jgi:S-formylglutathione hydrolase FrmB